VDLEFEDGTSLVAKMKKYIQRGGPFKSLEDRDYFRSLDIEQDGLVLRWPGVVPLDFSTETLWKTFASSE